jgi:hypothetical protein
MTETTFHLMDAATGRFLRQYGNPDRSTDFLSVDGDGPAYSTDDVTDIHRLMRLGGGDRSPFGLPKIDHIEDEFYPVAAVKRYGTVVAGGDSVLLSTDLLRVELEGLRTPRLVRSRGFSGTPRNVLKSYIPAEILSKVDGMEPELLVLKGENEPITPGEFMMTETYVGAKIGEVIHAVPLPENWPLDPRQEPDGLVLALVDYASKTDSYRVSDLSVVERAANTQSRPFSP